jgi:glycosyltransferase involved in cell wall biosynthesis
VSVVVPTRDRPATLEPCLRSLLCSEHDSFEVVVVDQSTDDRSEEVVRQLTDARLRYIRSSERGLSRARNAGLDQARGEVIAFTDDDCTVAPDWLNYVEADCTEPGGARVLYGFFTPGRPDTPDTFTPKFEPPRTRLLRSRSVTQRYTGLVAGGNMSAHRQVFEEIGGFDPVLGAGGTFPSSEDHDLMERALQAGFKVAFDPHAVVFHWGARSNLDGSAAALRSGYALAYGALLAKHLRRLDPAVLYRLLRLIPAQRRLFFAGHRNGREIALARGSQMLRGFLLGLRQPLDRRAGVFLERPGCETGTTPTATG